MRKFNHIAALIKRKRLSHPQGLSQSDLSHLLGYKNGQFISNVERALCNIPFKMINKVCDILHISAEEVKSAMISDYEDTIDAYLAVNDSFGSASKESAAETNFGGSHGYGFNAQPQSNRVETNY